MIFLGIFRMCYNSAMMTLTFLLTVTYEKAMRLLSEAVILLYSCFRSGLLWQAAGMGLLTVMIFFLPALWISWRIAGKRCRGERAGGIRKGILSVLLVLPPTLCGALLMLAFGTDGITGRALVHRIGWQGSYPWLGALLAGLLASVPVLRLSFQRALSGTDPVLLQTAETLGIRRRRAFWSIAVPGAMKGIAEGTILAAARAVGEYGACSLMAASGNGAGYAAAWIWDLGALAAGGILCAAAAGIFHCKEKRKHGKHES